MAELEERLVKAAAVIEERLDEELQRLDKLDEDGLEEIRRRRIEQMKAANTRKQELLAAGHGVYEELSDERHFFDTCKRSPLVVCLFSLPSNMRCRIVDKHLSALAPKHLATRFVHLNAEKFPFLSKRLNIRVIPTIAIAINGNTVDYIRGFDDLGGIDEFTTETLERRLAKSGVIQFRETKKETAKTTTTKIRDQIDLDDDEDW